MIGNAEVSALGQRAQRESVTLLRHDAALLPLDPSRPVRVFPYVTGRTKIDEVQAKPATAIGTQWPSATVVDTPEDADLALVWARPAIALFEDDREGVSLSVDPRDNGVDVDRVREIERTVPTILLVNITNPWLLGEIEPDAAAVVATFEITPENLLASLAGEGGGPAGRLPLTLPVSARAIADSTRDVPGRYLDEGYVYRDRDGVAYSYGHGLRF